MNENTAKPKTRQKKKSSAQATKNQNIKSNTEVVINQTVKTEEIFKNDPKPKKKGFYYNKGYRKPVSPEFPQKRRPGKKQPEKKALKPLKIAFLGGLDEVGKNMTLFEYDGDMIIVDCGLAFPDEDMPGVDLVIPDFSYVEANLHKIKGIVITHGHEDHIGGLPYLLKTASIPVYATRLTVGLIEGKLKEHKDVRKPSLNTVNPGDTVKLGKFDVELIHVNHSIPDAVGLAIKCGAGTVVHTGDFKIDSTPIDGGMIDIARFAALGQEGVLCFMADSTNAERPGFTESEKRVGESFEMLFRKADRKRIIVATFASNIHRVQQIIDVAESLGRKVALSGRSLENVVAISEELGYLKVPEGILIKLDMVNRYPPEDIVLITTGSQGEPMSALTRMAFSDHRKIVVGCNDYVIISANPIPGNEKMVGKVINELMKLGAQVVYEKMYDVHVSGHACREELKLMLGIVKPKYFIPVHGERKHLQKHYELGESMGIDRQNMVIAGNGTLVELTADSIKADETVPAGAVMIDGVGLGDVGSVVINDRKHLAQDGLIIIVATVDKITGELLSAPDIVSRGFVYVKENEELIEQAKQMAMATLSRCRERRYRDLSSVKQQIRDEVSRLMFQKTRRSPMILPVIMQV